MGAAQFFFTIRNPKNSCCYAQFFREQSVHIGDSYLQEKVIVCRGYIQNKEECK